MYQNKTGMNDHLFKGTSKKHLKADGHDNINYFASTACF